MVGNPKDRFSQNEAQISDIGSFKSFIKNIKKNSHFKLSSNNLPYSVLVIVSHVPEPTAAVAAETGVVAFAAVFVVVVLGWQTAAAVVVVAEIH